MTYKETLEFLYQQLPRFQQVGSAAFKKDLSNIRELCASLGDPQKQFRAIHIAGTNGKGSSAHTLASVLQSAGYKTGLYTSPHLKDFSERIKVDGNPIDQESVVAFVGENGELIEQVQPSFFEMTVALAFKYFAQAKVDIAVIEVGLGGRLDSTNIIDPLVSLITNISMDHQKFLGDSLSDIAGEKAGIIKEEVPVVIGERQPEISQIFERKAESLEAPIYFAQDYFEVSHLEDNSGGQQFEIRKNNHTYLKDVYLDLAGHYQKDNLPGVLMTADLLNQMGFDISENAIRKGFAQIRDLTGLKGRWQVVAEQPLMICDTGHNVGAWSRLLGQLEQANYDQLIIVLGLVDDKDPYPILELLPSEAYYYFCQAQVPRALEAEMLKEAALVNGLVGEVVSDVNQAITQARKKAKPADLIFIGGSTFVVAEIDNL
ncbi:MAG: bifunctional folylpolyglutamate synthase/dihydrofolate synthase [Cyclobacteriaceae bacterium]